MDGRGGIGGHFRPRDDGGGAQRERGNADGEHA